MRSNYLWSLLLAATLFTASAMAETPEEEEGPSFNDDLKLVDNALRNNPSGALRQSLESCLKQRNHAVVLNEIGMTERARRALQYCFDSLYIRRDTAVRVPAGPSEKELQAMAQAEFDKALTLTPDIDNGRNIYRECAACHEPEGWGLTTGIVPQIAGQHSTVVIKQLADFRAGNRDSILMAPYATVESIGGAQSVADVAEYISTLEISVENGKGPGTGLETGAKLYADNCAKCHGDNAEGSNEDAAPRLAAQHFNYLDRQFKWIREGKRRNTGTKMAFLEDFSESELESLLDYISRLEPPEELQAPPGWKNPDFAQPQSP